MSRRGKVTLNGVQRIHGESELSKCGHKTQGLLRRPRISVVDGPDLAECLPNMSKALCLIHSIAGTDTVALALQSQHYRAGCKRIKRLWSSLVI